mgnify:CR=1 FL=1
METNKAPTRELSLDELELVSGGAVAVPDVAPPADVRKAGKDQQTY